MIALCGAFALAGCDQVAIDGLDATDQWTMLGHDYRSSYTNPAQTKLSRENAHTLTSFWEFEARGLVYGTPVVVDGTVFMTSTGGLYAFEADTGRILWQVLDFGATSSLAYSEETIFVHDLGAFLHALDASTGTEKWRTRTDTHALAAGTSSPVVFEDYVVVGLSSNEIVRDGATFRGGVAAFDKNTGERLWRDYTANPPTNGVSVWSTVSIDTEARVVFAGTGQNYTGEGAPTRTLSLHLTSIQVRDSGRGRRWRGAPPRRAHQPVRRGPAGDRRSLDRDPGSRPSRPSGHGPHARI